MAANGPLFLLLLLILASVSSAASSLSDGDSLLAAEKAWGLDFSSWQGNNPCNASWERVECDADNRVTHLNLSNAGVVGPIPPEIGNLEHLTVLDLSNARNSTKPVNRITGNLSALEPLVNLASLNLSFNNIQSDTFPSAIFKLTKLVALRLDNNFISGALPKEFAQLPLLEYLYLGNNSIVGPIPPELGNLVNLRELSMWNNDLRSILPSELGNLKKLQYLNLHDCNLFGGLPEEFGNLTDLENISLYRNQLTGIIPQSWINLKNLTTLLLFDNYLTKTFPTWLYHLPKLYNISIAYNYFYGNLSNSTNSNLANFSVACNFFSGVEPQFPTTMIFNDLGNCFSGSDTDAKIKCQQTPYYNCKDFSNIESTGECPICPTTQTLESSATCECTLLSGTGGTKKAHKLQKIIGSIVGVGGFIMLVAVGGFLWCKWFRASKPSHEDFWEGPEGVQHFTLRDLSRATDDFGKSHEIGSGGFGKVFGGSLDGKTVAIKRAYSSSIQSSSGFRNEIILLSRLHHRNLVHLVGFCEEEGNQILVYEYMPNGNLHTLLFRNPNNIELDWLKRLDIAIGVAQGLEYLHSFADPPVIHRDVKPSNILLDEYLVAKIADFGISKAVPEFETQFATRPAGTVGYIDPQYILREQLTTASDVYSFGMVLLELITGQKAIDSTRSDDYNLIEWTKLTLKSGGVENVVDPRLGDDYPKQMFYDIIRLALDCASFESADRPSMKAAAAILDACRWSVAHLFQSAEDAHPSQTNYESDDPSSINSTFIKDKM